MEERMREGLRGDSYNGACMIEAPVVVCDNGDAHGNSDGG